MIRLNATVMAVVMLLMGSLAFAIPPAAITIHGSLTASDNSPLTGTRGYTVKFYDASAAGNQLGGDLTGTVTLTDKGLFNIAVTPPTEIFSALQVWYELAIDSDATPNGVDANDSFPTRTQVQKVPFAIQAEEAKHMDAAGIGNGDVDNATLSLLNGVTANVQAQFNSLVTVLESKANSASVYPTSETYSKTEVDGKLFTWETISGATAQMEPNHGYILTGDDPCTLTLPPSASLATGDTLKIADLAGEFTLAQNENQYVIGQKFTNTWTPRESNRHWRDVAVSGDGYDFALVGAVYGGYLYLSRDSDTWTPRMTDTTRNWSCVAASYDGAALIAGVQSGYLYVSLDSGANWQACTNAGSRAWTSVAISADGATMIASDNSNGVGGYLYTSSDFGANWIARMTDTVRDWSCVASSADGANLIAGALGEYLYTSTDSGQNWTARMTDADRSWRSLASSSDGTKLIAADAGTGGGAYLYTSTDSGATWTPHMTDSPRIWLSVASSADGVLLAAVVSNGYLYTSSDSGATWTPHLTDSTRAWQCVASSADGTEMLAGVNTSTLYVYGTFYSKTLTGVSGHLQSNYTQALELLYTGNDQFMVISHEGTTPTFYTPSLP